MIPNKNDNSAAEASRHSVAIRIVCFLVPLAFGLMALFLGQDNNWDLRNYHIYNAFAFLNHKVGLDLAPAQWQSYFNPTIDLPYYFMTRYMPAPLAGTIMGTVHGCNFLLVLVIARRLLPMASALSPLLLAGAGVLGSGFLSEIGNTMGDNLTSLLVLGALLLVLNAYERLSAGCATSAVFPGLIMGLGAGLKLTNSVYALALCLALLTLDCRWRQRLWISLLFGVAVLTGIAISAGHWFWTMWQVFSNPLFPQFNNIFHGPMALPIGIGDTGWLAKSWMDRLLWPFLFAIKPRLVSELSLTLIIWPLLYTAVVYHCFRRWRRSADTGVTCIAGPVHLTLVFFSIAYLGWLSLFGIYRYLIALELLAPLLLWILLQPLIRPPLANKLIGGLLIAVCALNVARLPKANWGHSSWRNASFAIETPILPAPARTLILTIQADPPMGWLATAYPNEVAFVSIGSAFPESPAYRARLNLLMRQRSAMMAMLDENLFSDPPSSGTISQGARLLRADAILAAYAVRRSPQTCQPYAAFTGGRSYRYRLCALEPK